MLAVQAYMAMRLLNSIAVEKCGQRAYQSKGSPTFIVDLRMLKVEKRLKSILHKSYQPFVIASFHENGKCYDKENLHQSLYFLNIFSLADLQKAAAKFALPFQLHPLSLFFEYINLIGIEFSIFHPI